MVNMTKLSVVYGDTTLGLNGVGFNYIFSYDHGGLESLVQDGKEWLYRVPQPVFWRATTDNDRGNGFSANSAVWLGADMFSSCSAIKVVIDGRTIPLSNVSNNNQYGANGTATKVTLTFTYTTTTKPTTTVDVIYTVIGTGRLSVSVHYTGQSGLPELPTFGLRLLLPTPAKEFDYEGLSGETYPDRLAGGKKGTYHVSGLPVTPYLVPQECGMHMQTKWATVTRKTTQNNSDIDREPFQLTFRQTNTPFAFSCLPYTPEELENATHKEELPAVRRTVLTIFGAVRGVGGIDSWGSDVEAPYHVASDTDHNFSFIISEPS